MIAGWAKKCAGNYDGLSLVFHYQSAFENNNGSIQLLDLPNLSFDLH